MLKILNHGTKEVLIVLAEGRVSPHFGFVRLVWALQPIQSLLVKLFRTVVGLDPASISSTP
jgi:hypothetical protein